MLKTELFEIIANGENSGVEFKRDDIRPEQLSREIVAMVNFQGGRILLGVEDDASITGLKRKRTEEWVMNVISEKIHPAILPYYEQIQVENNCKWQLKNDPPWQSKNDPPC
jgi:ATP-dependent DNA helicase RecG